MTGSRPPASVRPLDGMRVVELASVAPAPLCAMILADFGADVIVVERPGGSSAGLDLAGDQPLFCRGKQRVVADLKSDAGRELVTGLARDADVLVEGYRPGVLERLRLGPDELLAANPRLIYTRVTGWGQDGPYAARAGHDINYIAVAGALAQVGYDEPVPPGTSNCTHAATCGVRATTRRTGSHPSTAPTGAPTAAGTRSARSRAASTPRC